MTEITQVPDNLAACEQIIERGLTTFVEVGQALMRIRDGRLYKEAGYSSFELYCRERWQWGSRYANRQIAAAKVAQELGPIGPTPENEAQARQLAPHVEEIKE